MILLKATLCTLCFSTVLVRIHPRLWAFLVTVNPEKSFGCMTLITCGSHFYSIGSIALLVYYQSPIVCFIVSTKNYWWPNFLKLSITLRLWRNQSFNSLGQCLHKFDFGDSIITFWSHNFQLLQSLYIFGFRIFDFKRSWWTRCFLYWKRKNNSQLYNAT